MMMMMMMVMMMMMMAIMMMTTTMIMVTKMVEHPRFNKHHLSPSPSSVAVSVRYTCRP